MTSDNVTRAVTDFMSKCGLVIFCLGFFVSTAYAQDNNNNTQHQKAVANENQTKDTSAQDAEDQSAGKVRIKGGEDEVISEFRINGQLYMIRVTPKKGVPYYLVDSDGDGKLETRWNELAPNLLIPSWVLLRW
jgi:hypothetical protein